MSNNNSSLNFQQLLYFGGNYQGDNKMSAITFRPLIYSIIFFCFTSQFTSNLFAQSLKGDKEIAISYGLISGTEYILPAFGHGVYEDGSYTQTAHTGNIFATYRWYTSDNFSVGITAGYQSLAYTYTNSGSKFMFPSYTTKASVVTVAFEIKREYFHESDDESENESGKYFQLYSFMGLGLRYFSEVQTPHTNDPSTSPLFLNAQLSPICFRVGNGFGVFAEFGFGYKGLANFGCSYKLRPKYRKFTQQN